MTSDILAKALEIKDYIVQAKRRMHREPELSMREFKTTAFVKSELEAMGVRMIPFDSEVGVLGIIEGEKKGEGKVSALRADMDALPIQETADVPDCSVVPGVMHACGHDCHTAMLLGAAKLLVSLKKEFSGTVKFIFQPAEENLGGSDLMIRAGSFENPKVDAIFGIHGHSGFDVGQMAFREGPSMASSDFFKVQVKGIGGHGAYPHRSGCDPIQVASNAILSIQSIITRQIDALDSVVISICEIHGGTAKNVIPETVEFSGSVRCQNVATRATIENRISRIVEAIAPVYNCAATLDYHYGVPPLVNTPEITRLARESAKKVFGPDGVRHIDVPAMGSEDFSKYCDVVSQCVFGRIGITVPGVPAPIFHNRNFIFAEDALPYGTAMLAQFVLDFNR